MDITALTPQPHFRIMLDLSLAFIPLFISFIIFIPKYKNRNIIWWTGFIIFIAFLPNAPYALSDYIHILGAIDDYHNLIFLYFILLPAYTLYMLICFEAYVISLTLFTHYLKKNSAQKWVLKLEILINLLCALGIFLGRFQRLNSWVIVTEFNDFLSRLKYDFSHFMPIIIIIAIFIIIYILFLIFKKINMLIWNKITTSISHSKFHSN
ncbi:MAG TPA: DUF1361 domain-containing protein [Victivallales bacterium]|nr:DUF1361 domain-containing protein [Victivallales bacterium]